MIRRTVGTRTNRLRARPLLLLLAGAVLCLSPTLAQARPLTAFDLTIVGLELDVGPATQSVPKGVTSTVITLSAPAGSPLILPTLPLLGTYAFKNLRLVAGNEDLSPPRRAW